MVLVGMQPVLTQVPPNSLRSTMATFMPAAVRRPAREGPAWPVPMMMASKVLLVGAGAGLAAGVPRFMRVYSR